MKKYLLIIFLIPLILSCKQKAVSEKSIKDKAMEFAIKYARGKFTSAKQTIDPSGVVTVQDSIVNLILAKAYQVKNVIDPAKIKYGLINDDSTT